jgi:DNA/RNA-binding domain of Phe-tRNA-synthetase-like protein
LFPGFSKSQAYKDRYPDVPFGRVAIAGCGNPKNPPDFDPYKRKCLRAMRRRETLAAITLRVGIYERFFQDFGQPCPLPKHLQRTVHSGFPRYNLMVDAHFMAEMCAGILVAVTDLNRFEGDLVLDLAREGEACAGMGGRSFKTREGEIVLRDGKDIVCVLCQGADEKTRVREDTRDVLFYAYGVPGIGPEPLREGLSLAGEIMSRFGGGTLQGIAVD